ncbi:PDC sensor domain-containing protein [Synechococcus sp. CBW1004]|uniref:PDC sensor domain-containing protein n=1 Tax=Synechococcus sp. CBW1004 TaxID=1353136 RepID=UPI0018CE107F|nr:PDC sensor domain-containing protein [Synechococcus sp. CBW1004]QPN64222.1 cache domain-containing protein [Synechococcus sp. CBW1004]
MTEIQPRRAALANPAVQGVLFTLAWLAVTNVTIYFIYLRAVEAVKEEIRDGLLRNVSVAATSIDGDRHKTFTSKASRQDPAYLAFIAHMETLRKASTDVRYLYTNILKDGKVYFIANGSPQNDNDKDGKPDEAPQLMDPYPDAGKALQQALQSQKPAVDQEPYTDIWGTFYSAYAPFKDSQGRFVGTLGMDLELKTLQQRLNPIGLAAQRAAFTSGILAILFGTALWFFRSRNGILESLHHMAESRLHRVEQERMQERNAAAAQLAMVAARLEGQTVPVSTGEAKDQPAGESPVPYASALKRYAMARQGMRSEHAENFDPAALLRSSLPTDTPLQVARDVPSMVWGDPEELKEIIHALCFHPFSNTALGSLRELDLDAAREQLNTLDLVMSLRFADKDSTLNGSALIQDRYHPEHVFDEDSLQFATCCEQVRALGGSLVHRQESEGSELVVLTLPFEKFHEE